MSIALWWKNFKADFNAGYRKSIENGNSAAFDTRVKVDTLKEKLMEKLHR